MGPIPSAAARKELVPTVKVADATGWPPGRAPIPADGTEVTRFAGDLDHPAVAARAAQRRRPRRRVAAPPRPEEGKGIKGLGHGPVHEEGGLGRPSANRITLLRDGDWRRRREAAHGLRRQPQLAVRHGARRQRPSTSRTPTASCGFAYSPGATKVSGPPVKVADLPAGPRNHHWTKSLIASRDGARLYATVGSNSNVAENGMAEEEGRAAIWEVDPRAAASACSRRACAMPTEWPGSRTAARCGPRSTSATSSAPTSFPTS
jgi:glucose/arabinose dehydrogenase